VTFWGKLSGPLVEAFQSGEEFEWNRWEVRDGNRLAVFTYTVDPTHSGFKVCCPLYSVAHRGFVYADPRSGAIRRIIVYATGLTRQTPATAAGLLVDYGEVTISDEQYLLPLASTSYSRTGESEAREEIA